MERELERELDLSTASREVLLAIIARQQAVIDQLQRRIETLEGKAQPGGPKGTPGLKPKADRKPAQPRGPRKPRRHGFSRQRMTPTRRADRGMYGVLCRGMAGDLQVEPSRLGLGSGQGSGSSQTRLQSRPRCSNRRSQSMPCRITLTVRPGLCQGSRCLGDSALGGVRRLPGAILRSLASSTLVP